VLARRGPWTVSVATRIPNDAKMSVPLIGPLSYDGRPKGLRYIHSARRAIIGSTRVARRAGTIVATRDTSVTSVATRM
jgi:hypothetical protein